MKVLVIQQRYGIGDMVIFLPYLHALSKKLGSPITLLAKKSSNAEALFAYDEHISEIIELDKSKDGLRGFFKLAKELKSKDFGSTAAPLLLGFLQPHHVFTPLAFCKISPLHRKCGFRE